MDILQGWRGWLSFVMLRGLFCGKEVHAHARVGCKQSCGFYLLQAGASSNACSLPLLCSLHQVDVP